MSRPPPNRQISAKILKELQSGVIQPLQQLKLLDPNFHWSQLKYEKTGDTALHNASRSGQIHVVRYLIASFGGAGVDCKNNDDKTALHEAAQFSQFACARLLLEHGADVNALKRGDWTPLMLASTRNCRETVQLLLENGAGVNYCNKDGWNALHLICREGNGEIFDILLSYGGDFRARTKNGRSCLHIACLHRRLDIVKRLVGLLDVNEKDNCGNTGLHEAVLGRSVEICRILIEEGADVDCRNCVDFSLLHLASSEGYCDLIEFLVGELKFHVNLVNLNGVTPLHCAARKKQVETCQFLVQLGGDLGLEDKFGRTASDYLK